jgi:hypothetical protein
MFGGFLKKNLATLTRQLNHTDKPLTIPLIIFNIGYWLVFPELLISTAFGLVWIE